MCHLSSIWYEALYMPMTLRIAANGRVVIPADIRSELGLKGGDKLVVRVVDGAVVLEPVRTAIRRARANFRKYVPSDASLAAELIEERRRAASRE
jgi:AbrB family looped-hinge helix DNA binding protein